MQLLQTVNEIFKFMLLVSAATLLLISLAAPEDFGRWLQKIDNGRYEHVDCDCTEPL
jgi:hypothetical protein